MKLWNGFLIIILLICFTWRNGMAGDIKKPPLIKELVGNFIELPLENAGKAVNTVKKLKPFLKAGKVWSAIAPRGEVEVKGAILYEDHVVGVIDFNPKNGEVLPKGFHPIVYKVEVSLENIEKKLQEIIENLKVSEGAEYREPEYCWVVPLIYNHMIVAHIKIYIDGVHVVPAYKAQEEMEAFSK